jgi:flavin reductase (DIM6/NTAB) family NADH-FMN oxidoreductase RutF
MTGVTVVTTRHDDEMHGMTCNAFCSISLSPPTVMVSISSNTRSDRLMRLGKVFAVNVLSESQDELSNRFAGRHKDKEENRFEGFAWKTAVTGAPIFEGTQAYLDCKIVNSLACGDHTLYIAEVLVSGIDETKRPLIFYRSRYMVLDGLKPLSSVQ